MLDILPYMISSFTNVLLPLYASYKALETSDPAQLSLLLKYWVVFSLFTFLETWTWFIIGWLPFYAYIRLICLVYFVIPGCRGACFLYDSHIQPFLLHHETEIDDRIFNAYNRSKFLGLQFLNHAVEFIRQNILGMQPREQTELDIKSKSENNYIQTLLGGLSFPAVKEGLSYPTESPGDFYGFLRTTLGSANRSGVPKEERSDMVPNKKLLPQGMTDTVEKLTYLTTQRERLKSLLSALDRETVSLETEGNIEKDVERRVKETKTGGLQKSRSEVEFEAIDREEVTSSQAGPSNISGGSWMPWSWWAKTDVIGDTESTS